MIAGDVLFVDNLVLMSESAEDLRIVIKYFYSFSKDGVESECSKK